MMEFSKKAHLYILHILLVVIFIWDVFLFISPGKNTFWHYLFNGGYSLFYFLGSGYAFLRLNKYGLGSDKGKVFFFLACGFLSYGLGLLTWLTYNLVLKIEVPYPSLADVFYLLNIPLLVLSFSILLKSLKMQLSLKLFLEALVIFSLLFYILYSFLMRANPQVDLSLIETVLNILYPFNDVLLVTLGITGIRGYLQRDRNVLFFYLFSFLFLALADVTFTYQSLQGTYWNGNVADICFIASVYLLNIAINKTDSG